jgi:hypothetical protein
MRDEYRLDYRTSRPNRFAPVSAARSRVAPRRRRRRSGARGAVVALVVDTLMRLSRGWWTVDDLTADLGVSRRTMLRMLEALRDAGLPVVDAPAGDRDVTRALAHHLARGWWSARSASPGR